MDEGHFPQLPLGRGGRLDGDVGDGEDGLRLGAAGAIRVDHEIRSREGWERSSDGVLSAGILMFGSVEGDEAFASHSQDAEIAGRHGAGRLPRWYKTPFLCRLLKKRKRKIFF